MVPFSILHAFWGMGIVVRTHTENEISRLAGMMVVGSVKESRLVSEAGKYLKRNHGCRFFAKEVSVGGSVRGFRPDLVGIRLDGRAYVVECKLGSVNRPALGLGKLLFYRELILKDRGHFRRELRRKLNKQGKSSGCVSKIHEESIRYYLILAGRQPLRNMAVRISKHLSSLNIRVRVV